MRNSTSLLLVLALTALLCFYSCRKSIDKQAEINEVATAANTSKGNEVVPYKFERINEHNFYSQGWREEQVNRIAGVNVISTPTEIVEVVCGPENNTDPRLIPGCVTMNLPTSADPTLRRIRLFKGGYSTTRLADITELKFSTYVVANATANMVLQVDITGDNTKDFNMWFEPMQRSQGSAYPPLVLNRWQQWDALAGTWYIEFATVPGLPSQCTIAQLTALHPNARIMDDKPQPGRNSEGLYFTIGPPEFFENNIGYFDALIIGTKNEQHSTLFDFTCSQGSD